MSMTDAKKKKTITDTQFSIECKDGVTSIDPETIIEDTNQLVAQMSQYGMIPSKVEAMDGGKVVQEIVFPWAEIIYKKKGTVVPLLKNNLLSQTTTDRINNSVQHLEYAFANAFKTISTIQNKKIAYLKGNGQLESIHVYDFLKNTLSKNYEVIPFTLDSVQNQAEKTLNELKKFDLTIMAKPKEKFTDKEKYVINPFL